VSESNQDRERNERKRKKEGRERGREEEKRDEGSNCVCLHDTSIDWLRRPLDTRCPSALPTIGEMGRSHEC